MKLHGPFAPIAVLIGLLTNVYAPATRAESDSPVRLYVREVQIKIFGQEIKTLAIESLSKPMHTAPIAAMWKARCLCSL
jgi:hypothetical protein